jgi:hypothetical protein
VTAATVQRPPVTFLPSPFLGPAVWEPVAERLQGHGWRTRVAPVRGGTPAEVLDGFEEALPDDEPTVLVPHSNAGLYVPAVAAALPPAGTVFVDAALPPSAGEAALVPPALRDELRGRADAGGRLPPWTAWWPPAEVRALVPDDATLARVEAQARRLPAAYLDATVPVPAGWVSGRNAYLGFGSTYADELQQARAAGWPTDELAGGHLHMLVDPDAVAGAIAALLARI